jgi:pantoate--beta-alanine ligase
VKSVQSIEELTSTLRTTPRVFVPTMGALHAGHGELIRVARTIAGTDGQVVVSIFVNPLQFGPSEDFNKYPRTQEDDKALAAEYGADLVWFPESSELLSPEMTKLKSPSFGNTLEGKQRHGHFDGVLTIVNRLFEIVSPTHAIFGVKDLQQLILVRDMAAARFPNLEIVPVETIRTDSGLAMSSRNKYLNESEIQLASQINKALNFAALQPDPVASFYERVNAVGISADQIDYAEIVPMPPNCRDLGNRRLVVAVRVGQTRLLDNIALN